jgi:calpain-15
MGAPFGKHTDASKHAIISKKNHKRHHANSWHQPSWDLFFDPKFGHEEFMLNCRVAWIPARCLPGGDQHLFHNIHPTGMQQGQIGDCWLIAAISCLAEFPDFVQSMFTPQHVSPDGKYWVRLFDHRQGRMRDVDIDEFVPCWLPQWWHKHYQPIGASSNGNGMWCLLLEKAMAKVFGSYDNLVGGLSVAAFRAFTGEKRAFLWTKRHGSWEKTKLMKGHTKKLKFLPGKISPSQMFNTIKQYDDDQYLMSAAITPIHGPEYSRPDGLVEGHAFSLLQVAEVEGKRLVCLRNPWGTRKEWNGPWRDGDTAWRRHPEILRQLRPTFAEDGLFWMEFHDFERIFDNVEVCCRTMPKRKHYAPVYRAAGRPEPRESVKRALLEAEGRARKTSRSVSGTLKLVSEA